ncbi:MAG: LPXTG cell wall anchor domain-containing protein, partial [Streptococcus orisratti]|uniref:LPXTG cell wall anchor domain-containing protein n=1 Tax=Streptococcus orisratti TaxID=114652 RepID=UPI002A91D197
GTTSSTTEASQTSVADKGQASTTGAKQDNTTTSSQETKSETSNSSAPVATPTAVNGSKTASSATPAKTNQLPVTGESNLISTIMGITGLTLLLSWFGFKAYRESK